MDDFEDRLRGALATTDADQVPTSLPQRALERIARRRARQRATTAGGAALLLVAVALGVPALRDRGDHVRFVDTPPPDIAVPEAPAMPPIGGPTPGPAGQNTGGQAGAAKATPAPGEDEGPARPAGMPRHEAALQRVSLRSDGGEFSSDSMFASVSANGEVVAFETGPAPFRTEPGLLRAPDGNPAYVIAVRNLRTGSVETASLRSDGGLPSESSFAAKLSGDGGSVAFVSLASDLVIGDTNGAADVFVRRLAARQTVRATVGDAEPGGDVSLYGMSTDGNRVLFRVERAGFVRGAPESQLYVRDLSTGTTTWVSRPPQGSPGRVDDAAMDAGGKRVVYQQGAMLYVRDLDQPRARTIPTPGGGALTGVTPTISGDGTVIAYRPAGDGERDLVVRDLGTGRSVVATRDVEGVHDAWRGPTATAEGWPPIPRGGAFHPRLSHDGGRLMFMVAHPMWGGGGESQHVYLYDRPTGRTVLLSGRGGERGNGSSWADAITADGRRAVFTSWSSNLANGDRNNKGDVFLASLP